jgi:putative flippase GtrA
MAPMIASATHRGTFSTPSPRGAPAAFIVAATITWGLNRRYTFKSMAGLGSWVPYVLLTGVGALINIGVYWTWLAWAGIGSLSIVGGVAAGSVAALSFNFLASRAIFVKAL